MKILKIAAIYMISVSPFAAKKIALPFDVPPVGDSSHSPSINRTEELIRKLKDLKLPQVMIFANACRREDTAAVISQLKKYVDAGHLIGNHSCSHPRLDDVGFETYANDVEKGEKLLAPLIKGQKYFRFPYLNEGKDAKARDQMREWLRTHNYRNGMVSIDNDDYLFSFKMNKAKELGKKIDYKKVEALFIEHMMSALNFYDEQAMKAVGYSPKHVLLLHEMDATVMFLEPLIKALKENGWKIIGVEEAFADKIYSAAPKNTYAGNGILPQIIKDKTGEVVGHFQYEELEKKLDKLLGL